MALKPWHLVVQPRKDLVERRSIDMAEFAAHLDHVRDGSAPDDYRDPQRFFERTYLTRNLTEFAVGVVKRLSGIRIETSAVWNLATNFGGGKTHALTMLYHLAKNGPRASDWTGVDGVLQRAGVRAVPEAAVAVFVGIEFDSIQGRGGGREPARHTPWGEIAWQVGGAEAFAVVERHDREGVAPAAEVIRKFLPRNKPTLILIDELMAHVNQERKRRTGQDSQIYNFLQTLSEEARTQDNVVLAVSVPGSILEMSAEDEHDYSRLKKLLDRVGRPVVLAEADETAEIIRRRLFEWTGIPREATAVADAYAEWLRGAKGQVPPWFPIEKAREKILANYPFHPALLSVFERKWQSLPRFQRTRGVLRLLALWVSHACRNEYLRQYKDPLLNMGTAPLDDSDFRNALLQQLGEERLDIAITTDIQGRAEAHAARLDAEANAAIRDARLHQKVATAIFLESNGGQSKDVATPGEIRLAVGEPGMALGDVETVLDALKGACYYLSADSAGFRFGLSPNLNKLVADRQAGVEPRAVEERIREVVQEVFGAGPPTKSINREYFPDGSGRIADRPLITLVVLSVDQAHGDEATRRFIEVATREHGSGARVYKSALIWVVPDGAEKLRDQARRALAWAEVSAERSHYQLDDVQRRLLDEAEQKSRRELKDQVWRTWRHLWFLDSDGSLRHEDLGPAHSSSANSLVNVLIERLKEMAVVETDQLGARWLVRNWPGSEEWSTKGLRDAAYASPRFPRLLDPESIKKTIARGVADGLLAYVTKGREGKYDPFLFRTTMVPQDVEIADDVYVIRKEAAEAYLKAAEAPPAPAATPLLTPPVNTGAATANAGGSLAAVSTARPPSEPKPTAPAPEAGLRKMSWQGDLTAQRWMTFYRQVLARFATDPGLQLSVRFEVAPTDGVSKQQVEETRAALREAGLTDNVETE